jgi:HSP20 family molecular chaperone IbpA
VDAPVDFEESGKEYPIKAELPEIDFETSASGS